MGFEPIVEPNSNKGFQPFENVNGESETVFREDTNKVISAPPNLTGDELTYLDDVQNEGVNSNQYFGVTKIANSIYDYASAFGRGMVGTAVRLGGEGEAGARLRKADAIKQGLTEDVDRVLDKFHKEGALSLTKEEQKIVQRETVINSNLFSNFFASQEEKARKKARELKVSDKRDDVKRFKEAEKFATDLEKSANSIRKETDRIIKENFKRPEEGMAKKFIYDFGGVTTSIGASIGLAVVTKNPVTSAALFSEIQESSVYIEARDAGVDVETAREKSALAGTVEGAIEFVGVNTFFKIAENSKGLTRHLKRAGEEAIQELSQQTAEELITQTGGIRESELQDTLERIGYSALLGFMGGGVTSVTLDQFVKNQAEENKLPVELVDNFVKATLKDGQAEKIIINELNQINNPVVADKQAEAQASKIMQDFAEGRPVNIESLSQDEQAAVKQMIAEKPAIVSEVKKVQQQISAQEGKGIMPVPKAPENLSKFIKKSGGLKDDTGEARKFTRKESPTLGGVAKRTGKLDLDTATSKAIEAGFLPEGAGINDLIEALENESIGIDTVVDIEAQTVRDEIIEFNAQQDRFNQELLDGVKEIKTISQAFKKGVSAAKKDVKAVQTELIKLLDASALAKEDKANFIKTIKNIQTFEQLEKNLSDIEARIVKSINRMLLGKQKARLKKLLSSKTLKKKAQSGKKVGKFDAATQEKLETLRSLSRLNQEDAAAELQARLDDDRIHDPLENRILSIAAGDTSVDAGFVAIANAHIEAIRQFGLAQAEARINKKKSTIKRLKQEIDSFIDPENKALTQKRTGLKSSAKQLVQKAKGVIDLLSISWDDITDIIAPESVVKDISVSREVTEQKRILRKMQDKMINAAKKVYGVDNGKIIKGILLESDELQDLGVFTNMRDEQVRIEISRSQARKLWMEYQSKSIKEGTLQNEKGNAYTDEMMSAMLSVLTQEDINFAKEQLKIYEDFYDDINAVYSKVFGVNLPQEEFYSPISREIARDELQDNFMREIGFRRALASGGALKMREKSASAPLKRQSDILVYNKHILEMARFIAFREKTEILDGVFGDPDLMRKVEILYGAPFKKLVDDTIRDMAHAGEVSSNVLDNMVSNLNRNFATSVLGLKAKIGITQTSSYFAYAEFIPVKAFISGTRDFFMNPKKAIKILSQSELMQDRGANEDADIARFGNVFDNKTLKKIQTKKENLIDYSLIFTKWGDRATIYVGGWSVYKHAIDNGATHEEAIAAFEDATSRTQQSKDVDKLAYIQRANPMVRGLAMFMSAPLAQYRGEMRAIRKFKKGEFTKKQLAKSLIIYHVIIPQVYQALANGLLFGEWDEDDQLRALIFGSLNGIPLLGNVLTFAARELQDKPNMPADEFKWIATMKDALLDALRAIGNGVEGDFEEAVEHLKGLGDAGAMLSGVPMPQIENAIKGIEDYNDGKDKSALLRFLGFPDSVARKANESDVRAGRGNQGFDL